MVVVRPSCFAVTKLCVWGVCVCVVVSANSSETLINVYHLDTLVVRLDFACLLHCSVNWLINSTVLTTLSHLRGNFVISLGDNQSSLRRKGITVKGACCFIHKSLCLPITNDARSPYWCASIIARARNSPLDVNPTFKFTKIAK